MTSRLTVFLLALGSLLLTACGPKQTPVPVEDLRLWTDPVRKFEILVPSNWLTRHVPGDQVVTHTSGEVVRRFFDFAPGTGGAKIVLQAIPVDTSNSSVQSVLSRRRLQFDDEGYNPYTDEETELNGVKGRKLWCEFAQEDGYFRSEIYAFEFDSVITLVEYSAFGSTYPDYADVFAKSLQSVKFARRPEVRQPDTLAPTGPEPPSDTLRPYQSPDFTIEVPSNFQSKKANTTGAISSVVFSGSRLDCTIQVDILDASKQNNLDRILERNALSYGRNAAQMLTFGGVKAGVFTYSPVRNIRSKAYFAVKGDKLFRVSVNWFTPEESVYWPIFEKSLASFVIK